MNRPVTTLILTLLVVLAGCTGLPSERASVTKTSVIDTNSSPTSTTQSQNISVQYVIHTGEIPDELQSVTVTLRVVFVEKTADLGPCWRDTYKGPYKPTPTPIRLPSGDCYRSSSVSIDLTEIEKNHSLGRFTAPSSFSAGHALIVTNITATYQNGTVASGIKGTGGQRANIVKGLPDSPYHVEVRVDFFQDRDYNYWIIWESIKPSR